jgi:hypothetical protein
MAIEVLTRLHLLTLEQIAGWDIEPAGNRFHQLVAGDREAIHIPAAGSGYQECAIAGIAATNVATMSNGSRMRGTH